MTRPPRLAPALVCWVALAAGCGSGAGDGKVTQKDEEAIAGLVADAAEKCSAPQPARELFVTPPDRAGLKRYAALSYEPAGRASVRGGSATIPVRVTNADGKDLGTVDWAFVKSGEQWKLESAPLP